MKIKNSHILLVWKLIANLILPIEITLQYGRDKDNQTILEGKHNGTLIRKL